MAYIDPNFHEDKPHYDDENETTWNHWGKFYWTEDDNPFPIWVNKVAIIFFSGAVIAEIFYLCYSIARYGLYQ